MLKRIIPIAPDSATSQFFINVVDNPYLNHQPGRPGYAVFGRVVEGIEIIDKMAATPTKRLQQFANLPVSTIVIRSVKKVRPPAN